MSLTYTVGQTVVWGLKTYTAAGVLADLGGGDPTATVTKPDATTSAASVAKTATGTYTASFATTLAGRHRITWTGTGDNSGGLPYVDVADVWPVDPRFVISLAEARAALNVPSSTIVDDDELRLYLAAATPVIERIAGAVLSTSVVEYHSGGKVAINLNELPASVTSVTEDGTTLTEGSGFVWSESGVLWRGSVPGGGYWAPGARNVVVTYVVGSSTVDANVKLAAAKLVAHWWQQGQQSYYVDGPPDDGGAVYVAGYAVPNAVVDLLAPYAASHRMPGFA